MTPPRSERRRGAAPGPGTGAPVDTPDPPDTEGGFTIVEMVVAMTLMAIGMLAFAQMMYGGMGALVATRQRSVFLELATAEMESLRAIPYDKTCVAASDPNTYATFEGANAVVGASCDAKAVSDMPGTEAATAHVVRRWITWTNPTGENVTEATATFKRLTVELEWREKNETPRTIRLSSVRYPGGFGPTGKAPGTNKEPVAIATAIPQFGANPGDPIVFDASASTDDGGAGNLTYTWDFDDGDVRTGAIVANKSFASVGTYQVLLTVKDSGGLTGDRLLQVSVVADNPANLAPTAAVTASCHGGSPPSATCDPLLAVAPLGVTFDASGSADPDPPTPEDGLYFVWDWKDGSPLEGGLSPVRSHVFAAARTYQVEVTAIDPYGRRSTVTVPVTARPLNCEITSGSFVNGGMTNHIRVKGNGTPHSATISFSATSNTACTNLKVRLPVASGTGQLFYENLSSMSDGTTVTWTGSRTIPTGTAFHLLANQTVEFTPSQATGTFPGTFTVTRDNT